MKPVQLGLHVSVGKSLDSAFDKATEIGCTTFQIFTRNPRSWAFKPLSDEAIAAFHDKRKKTSFRTVVAHMPYLPNLASPERHTMKASRESLAAEVKRCDALRIEYLVAHLGSHLGKGSMVGMRNVAEACRLALGASDGETTVLLENMAGQKNCVGASLEELAQILEMVKSERLAVCFDTCHAFAAGFDLSSQEAVGVTIALFDEVVGLDRLKVVHLNDSKGPLGGRLDRHEFVGKGKIGAGGFRAFLHANAIAEKPLIMETPFENVKGMKESLATVRKLMA